MADLLIAGGGPAGATLAICAGRAGISVDLFDSARFPREKACGEGLMPGGVGVLGRLGLLEATAGQPFAGVRYHGFGITAEAQFPAARRLSAGHAAGAVPSPSHSLSMSAIPSPASASVHGLGQRRLVLDAALLAAARATPHVRVFEGATVEGVVQRAGRSVGLRVDGTTVPGALVVGADGARSRVRRALDLDGPPGGRSRYGVRMHFRLAAGRPTPPLVEIFVGGDHEIYLTPLPAGEVLVAALAARGPAQADARGALGAWIAMHPALREQLQDAEIITAPRGRFPLASTARAGVAPGAVLIGDAAGFCDPITGGGMAQALLSAELLASFLPRALADRDDEWLWRFDSRRRALLRAYVALTHMMLIVTRRPTWARWTLQAMRFHPPIMRRLVAIAGGVARGAS